jgi:hypothetical protein
MPCKAKARHIRHRIGIFVTAHSICG